MGETGLGTWAEADGALLALGKASAKLAGTEAEQEAELAAVRSRFAKRVAAAQTAVAHLEDQLKGFITAHAEELDQGDDKGKRRQLEHGVLGIRTSPAVAGAGGRGEDRLEARGAERGEDPAEADGRHAGADEARDRQDRVQGRDRGRDDHPEAVSRDRRARGAGGRAVLGAGVTGRSRRDAWAPRATERPDRPDGLTDKMWRFVQELLGDPERNASEAYRRAGYRAKNDNVAAAAASQLLRRPAVQQAILDHEDAFRKRIEEKYDVSRESMIQDLLAIARLDVADLFTEEGQMLHVVAMPDRVRTALQGLEISETFEAGPDGEKQICGFTKKVRLGDRGAAIERAAKLLGYLRETIVVARPLVVLDDGSGD